ncbi:MAG TPA: histidine kinase dimerization/phospho-acceptor domain-containing protein, partial [Chloroflexia bacterium]|nr:histidine kinase dimerization/phospho-acceptor domain-containing protein [Chloroflexia bacterium]
MDIAGNKDEFGITARAEGVASEREALLEEIKHLRNRVASLEHSEAELHHKYYQQAQETETYRSLIEGIAQFPWTTGINGEALEDFPAWRHYTGQSKEEVRNSGWQNAIHPEDREQLCQTWKKQLIARHPFNTECRVRRFDGFYEDFYVYGAPVLAEDGSVCKWVGACVNSSHFKQIEARLKEQTDAMAILNRVGPLFLSELDMSKLVQAATDTATGLTGAEFGAFFYNLTDENGESYTLYTLSGVPHEAFSQFPMPRNTHIFGPTFRGESIIRLDDVRKDPRFGQNAPYFGMPQGHLPVVSYLALPVVSRSGKVLGGLFFGHSRAGVFKEWHEHLLTGLVAQIATAMDNARLFEEAQQAVRVRDEFLVAASHELKTPMTSMRGFSQLALRQLEKGSEMDPSKVKQAVEIINQQSQKMGQLVSQLLDVSRIDAGRLALEVRRTDVTGLVGNLVALTAANSTKHTLLFYAPDRIEALVDPIRLEQVVTNLLDNAIKYSPEGGRIKIELIRSGVENLLFSVTDEGIGIPPE